jgi:hypothetical protein
MVEDGQVHRSAQHNGKPPRRNRPSRGAPPGLDHPGRLGPGVGGRQRAVRLAVVALLALGLGGCQTIRYQTGRRPAPTHVVQDIHFFMWGLIGEPVVDLDAACPQGVAEWRSDATGSDWLVDVLTLGIYNPRTVTIQCVEVSR